MKDMPTLQPAGLAITCCLPREDVRDAFVTLGDATLATLPAGAAVGTSSLRRRAQLRHRRPDLAVVEFRGSVETRLRKLADGVAAATFLAMAGLHRLGMAASPRTPIDPDEMLPAIAQGAIGVEQRRDDDRVAALLAAIHDAATGHRLAAERAFLAGPRRLLPDPDRRPRRARRRAACACAARSCAPTARSASPTRSRAPSPTPRRSAPRRRRCCAAGRGRASSLEE